jgi:hypothetical protein
MPRRALADGTCPACGATVRPVVARPRGKTPHPAMRDSGSTARALEDRLTAYCG